MKDIQVLKKELIEKAMHCKNAEELMALAESEGITLTKEEAEAYLAEMEDMELNGKILNKVAGGSCWSNTTCDENECNPAHPKCFTGDSEVAVPGGIKLIKDLQVGDNVITLDAEGNEIVGVVTEVMPPQEEEIFEVTFSDGTVWHATGSQTLYFGHGKSCTVREALGKTALKRGGAAVTVTGVKSAGIFETVYDVLVGEKEDEDVIFVAGIAAEGDFTKGGRGQGAQVKTVA
jgi:predicted DNA-binding protein